MSQSQYAASANLPLIKSPSLRVPQPVTLPPDIHPLPDSVTEYFVYPFTLEQHVITLESARRQTLASHAARREAYLRSRTEERERRKRDALRRIAPGFEPASGPLVPTRVGSAAHSTAGMTSQSPAVPENLSSPPRDVMEDLVSQLAALDSSPTA